MEHRTLDVCDSNFTSIHSLLKALKACSKLRDLQMGKQLHAAAEKSGLLSNMYLANTLIDMYAKCNKLVDAKEIFDSMDQKNAVSWNCIIMGYVENGHGEVALDLYKRMQDEGCTPNRITVVVALKACASLTGKGLEMGRTIHSFAVISGYGSYVSVSNSLVNMYGKCGCMEEAWKVFSCMPRQDVVSWNSIIGGYVQNGDYQLALQLFSEMKEQGHTPSAVTIVVALKACAGLAEKEDDIARCVEKGRTIHCEAVRLLGKNTDMFIANTLIDMYSKCSNMVEAQKVFDSLQHPTVVSWTALILGYSQCQQGKLALTLFDKMREQGCKPNALTYVAALRACANLGLKNGGLESGKRIHFQAAEEGLDKHDVFVCSSIVDMYSKCNSIEDARLVFQGMPRRNVVSWNCIILGYAQIGEGTVAFELFTQMLQEQCCFPDYLTFIAAVKACIALASNEQGRMIQGIIVKVDSLEKGRYVHFLAEQSIRQINVFLYSSLVEMYSNCGSMSNAITVFKSYSSPNIVMWNCIIQGHVDNAQAGIALELFSCVQNKGQLVPDSVTFVAAVHV